MKYGDKIIRVEGVIVEVHDGCIGIDLKGLRVIWKFL